MMMETMVVRRAVILKPFRPSVAGYTMVCLSCLQRCSSNLSSFLTLHGKYSHRHVRVGIKVPLSASGLHSPYILPQNPAVEAALLRRLAKKAAFYGQELDANGNPKTTLDQIEKENLKIDVEEVVALYRDYIIPLTKEVEVTALFFAFVVACSH
jgi:hypothetical protein